MGGGRLIGIARHDRPRGPIETIDHVRVTLAEGVQGDFRGAAKPGSKRKRQVTVMALADWQAAMAELGNPPIDWSARRVNLLVDGIVLPRETGDRLVLGDGAVLEVTGECDPCSRMEEVAPGLKAALMPDWRGGVNTRVLAEGSIAIGDEVRIESA